MTQSQHRTRSTPSIMGRGFVPRDLRVVVSVLVWSLFTSPHTRLSVQANKINCDVPSVAPMTNTLLTCHFPEDVNHTKRDFTVYKYSSDRNPDAVLDCWWLMQKLECFVGQGYKYDGRISDKLSLEIPRVSASHIGTYACQLSSYGSNAINTCDLTLSSVGRSVCEVSSVKLKPQTELVCYFPEDLSRTRADFTVYHYSKGAQAVVLSCKWERDDVNCNTTQGFQFDKKVSDHLTLRIPHASEAHEGTYSCQTPGVKYFTYEKCYYTLQEAKSSSCTIPSVKEMEPTELTCIFSVDVRMTRQDFKVVRLDDGGTNVVSCTWPDDKPACTTTPGYHFNNTVTDRLVVKIPQATPEQRGTYSCHLQNFDVQNFESCELVISTDSVNTGVTVGVIVGVVVLIALVIATIFLLRKLRICSKKVVSEEEYGMLPRKNKQIKMELINFLSTSCKEMYEDIMTRFYFVPSLYVNRNKYKVVEFAGEKFFITQECSKTDLSHDKAMQTILHNLHLLAEDEKEVMFVISQFKYNSYLTTSIKSYKGHHLPMPATLRKRVKDYGDFDLLIVHRQYGLVVAVVEACVDEYGDDTKTTEDTKLQEEIRNGAKRLNNAEHMIQHLLSDTQWSMPVRKTLMLPNVSQQTVEDVLNKQNKWKTKEKIALTLSCTDMSKDTCLCSEQLTSANSTQSMKQWLHGGFTTDFTDEQYLTVISRFCSPASRSPLPVPDTIPRDILPVTLEHAVCLTGDLFTSTILHKDHMALLKEAAPRVLLLGPPGTGKTRMLVLIGKRWQSEGHHVHVVSTWEKSRAASRLLFEILSKGVKTTGSETGHVTLHDVDINSQSVEDIVEKLFQQAKGGNLFILCDEAESERGASSFTSVCEKLMEKVPDLHLWYTSCFHSNSPKDWTGKVFVKPISVPPVILQEKEVLQGVTDCQIYEWGLNSRSQPPTEGPEVKHVVHYGVGHSAGDPHDCDTCSTQVVTYLQSLITDKAPSTFTSTPVAGSVHSVSPKATRLPELRLCEGDVLVLTEGHLKEEATFFKKLSESGFKTTKLQEETHKTLFEDKSNRVLIAEEKDLYGYKRKIVVYLEAKCIHSKVKTEGKQGQSESSSVKLNRLRGLTSCTSQLIWVKAP